MDTSSQAGLASMTALAVLIVTVRPLVIPSTLPDDAITSVPKAS